MALTKITGQVINDTTGLVVGVTTVGGGLSATDGFFSGIVTAVGDASFSGNVSVGGTLTYEDVTNIDAVGLVTARNGIVVGSGITLSKDGDIFATGVTTATTFSGSGASLTNLNASNLASGTVPTARLGSGTASSSTFLRGDSTFAAVTSTTINNNANNRLITGSGTANTLEAETNIIFDGTNLDSGATTDNSVKTGTLRVNHYTHSATNPINVIGCSSGNGYNNVQIGGNDTSFSGTAATGIRFYTGGTATTANGTLRAYFDTGGNFGISNGNIVIGTAGKGIDFSAQTASSDSGVTVGDEVLDHYEEGTWTPVLRHYLNGSFQAPAGNAGTVKGYYTRVGDVCYINATFSAFSYSNLTVSSFAQISELPFAASSSAGHISVINATGTAFSQNNVSFISVGGQTYLNSKTDDSNWDWAIVDGGTKYLYVSGFYFV